MKTPLLLITTFTLFILFSCNSTDKDPRRTQKVHQPKLNKEQITPLSSEQVQHAEAEATEKSSTEPTQAEVMLNPPHGQPYHRCDIPVGAPLNAPPANASSQTTDNSAVNTATQTTKNPTAPTIENAMKVNPSQTQNAGTADKGTKPKLNPAHGQPYHRCDIPVGSPLP
jgi:hypothetical protein